MLRSLIEPGQVVKVPGKTPDREPHEHQAVFGDSLRRLGWQYGQSVEALARANPGLRLRPLRYVFHQLRHTNVSYLLGGEDPISLAAAAKHGGLTDMLTPLRHYTHAITEDDRRTAEKAGRLLADALAVGEARSVEETPAVVRANVRASGMGESAEALSSLELAAGIEPATCALRVRRSAG